MSRWNQLYEYFARALETVRSSIDVEHEADSEKIAVDAYQSIEQSRSEKFLQRIAAAIDAVLNEEIIRAPSGRAFVPENFIVFLNSEDDQHLQGKKREFVKEELAKIIFDEARRRAAESELTIDNIEINFRVDGTLAADEMRVSASFDQNHEMTVVASGEKTVVYNSTGDQSPQRTEVSTETDPLYTVEIAENGRQIAVIPVYLREAVIGRSSGNFPIEIPLNKADVSRRHAVIELDENGNFWLTHLGANPTRLDGAELLSQSRVELQPNQPIEIAGFVLKVKSED